MGKNWYRWFLAGSMLGALGITMAAKESNQPQMKKMRRKVSRMTGQMVRDAGDTIGSFGEHLAKKMH